MNLVLPRLFRLPLWGALVAFLLLPFGCATLSGDKFNEKSFYEAIEEFNDAIRWMDFQRAILWVVPEEQDELWKQSEVVKTEIRFIDYQIQRIVIDDQTATGDVQIHCRYYRLSDPHIQTKTYQQTWVYDQQIKNWQVSDTGLRAIVEAAL